MALVVAQRRGNEDLDARVLFSQAGYHMRMMFSLFGQALSQSIYNIAERIGLVGLFHRICRFFDPAVYAVYKVVDRFCEFVSDRIWPVLHYHVTTAWAWRKALTRQFTLAFLGSFACQLLFLSFAKAAGYF